MITLKYFGSIAEKVKANQDEIELADYSLRKLITHLKEKHQLNEYVFNIAVNQKMIQNPDSYELKPNDTVAFLPPFAGG